MAAKVLAIILAGGEGKRLMPLTADRAKPGVPFGGIYRMVDFVLSNIANGGYLKMVVLTQYKSHSLDRHISLTWRMSTLLGNYVTPVPAQQRLGPQWFQAVRGDHVWDPVQQLREVAGEVRVPRVAVHQVGARATGGDLDVDTDRAERRVRAGERDRVGIGGHAGLGAPGAEAPHPGVEHRSQ